jgi:endonuclease I
MATPNPEAFAKAMLWHLTGLRADVSQIYLYLLEQKTMQTGKTHQQILDEWQAWTHPHHEKLYREALAAAGLRDDRPGRGGTDYSADSADDDGHSRL